MRAGPKAADPGAMLPYFRSLHAPGILLCRVLTVPALEGFWEAAWLQPVPYEMLGGWQSVTLSQLQSDLLLWSHSGIVSTGEGQVLPVTVC